MALPASGAISLNQVNVELGVAATATRSLNDSTTRALFGVASGQISLSQGYGKANQFSFNISSNQTNANLRTLAVNAGWNQTTKVVATINSGIYISSNGTGTPALTVDGSFPGGIELINSGTIVGRGGTGGNGINSGLPLAGSGQPGGPALSVSSPVSINNAGTIAGGGGGGGGGRAGSSTDRDDVQTKFFGGGGGGGRSSLTNSSGGSPNGGTGTISAYGLGGPSTGGGSGSPSYPAAPGNNGGGWGEAGVTGGYVRGGTRNGNGGGSGNAVSGNGNVTWLATGTRLGGIS